jgi:hypothetical protein
MPEIFRWKSRSFVLSLYTLPITKLQGYWDWLERFVDFLRNISWIIGSFGEFFRTECFGSKNPKFWITVFVRHLTSTKIAFPKKLKIIIWSSICLVGAQKKTLLLKPAVIRSVLWELFYVGTANLNFYGKPLPRNVNNVDWAPSLVII